MSALTDSALRVRIGESRYSKEQHNSASSTSSDSPSSSSSSSSSSQPHPTTPEGHDDDTHIHEQQQTEMLSPRRRQFDKGLRLSGQEGKLEKEKERPRPQFIRGGSSNSVHAGASQSDSCPRQDGGTSGSGGGGRGARGSHYSGRLESQGKESNPVVCAEGDGVHNDATTRPFEGHENRTDPTATTASSSSSSSSTFSHSSSTAASTFAPMARRSDESTPVRPAPSVVQPMTKLSAIPTSTSPRSSSSSSSSSAPSSPKEAVALLAENASRASGEFLLQSPSLKASGGPSFRASFVSTQENSTSSETQASKQVQEDSVSNKEDHRDQLPAGSATPLAKDSEAADRLGLFVKEKISPSDPIADGEDSGEGDEGKVEEGGEGEGAEQKRAWMVGTSLLSKVLNEYPIHAMAKAEESISRAREEMRSHPAEQLQQPTRTVAASPSNRISNWNAGVEPLAEAQYTWSNTKTPLPYPKSTASSMTSTVVVPGEEGSALTTAVPLATADTKRDVGKSDQGSGSSAKESRKGLDGSNPAGSRGTNKVLQRVKDPLRHSSPVAISKKDIKAQRAKEKKAKKKNKETGNLEEDEGEVANIELALTFVSIPSIHNHLKRQSLATDISLDQVSSSVDPSAPMLSSTPLGDKLWRRQSRRNRALSQADFLQKAERNFHRFKMLENISFSKMLSRDRPKMGGATASSATNRAEGLSDEHPSLSVLRDEVAVTASSDKMTPATALNSLAPTSPIADRLLQETAEEQQFEPQLNEPMLKSELQPLQQLPKRTGSGIDSGTESDNDGIDSSEGSEIARDFDATPRPGSENSWPEEEGKFIWSCVEQLFSGESLEQEELEKMAHYFSAKWGRRCFSSCLNQQRVRERIGLQEAQFCELCSLFEAALIEAERNADFRCAKHLIHMSITFYRTVGTGFSETEINNFVQHTLKRSDKISIWKETVFWEEIYYDAILEEREKLLDEFSTAWRDRTPEERDEILTGEKNFVFGQLGSYSCTMLSYGIPVEKIKEFIIKQAEINVLPPEQVQMLMESIDHLQGEKSEEDDQRETKLKKEAWLRQQKAEWAKTRQKRLKMKKLDKNTAAYRVQSRTPSPPLSPTSPTANFATTTPLSPRSTTTQTPAGPHSQTGELDASHDEQPKLSEHTKYAGVSSERFGLSKSNRPSVASSGGKKKSAFSDILRPISGTLRWNNQQREVSKSSDHNAAEMDKEEPRRGLTLEEKKAAKLSRSQTISTRTKGSGSSTKGSGSGTFRRQNKDKMKNKEKSKDKDLDPDAEALSPRELERRKEKAFINDPVRFEQEVQRIKDENTQLEATIQLYERQFSVEVLASLLYLRLAPPPNGLPPPYGKVGILNKLVGNLKKTWSKRLFVIKDDFLFYYKSSESKEPCRVIRLRKTHPIRVVKVTFKNGNRKDKGEITSSHPYCLQIPAVEDIENESGAVASWIEARRKNARNEHVYSGRRRKKHVVVRAENEDERAEWLYCLRKASGAVKWFMDRERNCFPSWNHRNEGAATSESSGPSGGSHMGSPDTVVIGSGASVGSRGLSTSPQ